MQSNSWIKRALGLGLLTFLSVPSIHSKELDVRVELLYPQTGNFLKGHVVVVGDKLVTAMSSQGKVAIYSLSNLKEPLKEIPTKGENLNLVVHPSGWVAACTEKGYKIHIIDANNPTDPERQFEIDFDNGNYDTENYISCSGLALQVVNKDYPYVLVGSVADRRIILMESDGDIAMRYAPVKGVYSLALANDVAFAVVNAGTPYDSFPYAINLATGDSVIGDRLGANARFGGQLTSGYSYTLFEDVQSRSVFYVKPFHKMLHRFSTENPDLATSQQLPVSNDFALAVNRYGKCIAVLGTTTPEIPDLAPAQWVIYRSETREEWKEIRKTSFFLHKELEGAQRQAIDSLGNIYVAGWNGISKVSGLFEGLDCQP